MNVTHYYGTCISSETYETRVPYSLSKGPEYHNVFCFFHYRRKKKKKKFSTILGETLLSKRQTWTDEETSILKLLVVLSLF